MKAREGGEGGGTREEPLLDGQNEGCPASGARGEKRKRTGDASGEEMSKGRQQR